MTVSNGGPGQTGNLARTLPGRSNPPSTAYANALSYASGDSQNGSQAGLGATAGTRSEKAQLARESTSGVARSMNAESHQAAPSGRSSSAKTSSAYHQAGDNGGARTHVRSSIYAGADQGKAKKQAVCGEAGAGKKKEGDGKIKDPGRGDKAVSPPDKASRRRDGNSADIADKKSAQGRSQHPRAGVIAAKDVMSLASQGKVLPIDARTKGKATGVSPSLDSWVLTQSRPASSSPPHAAQQQRSGQSAVSHPNLQGPLGDAAFQQTGIAQQPTPHQHVTPAQSLHPLHAEAQHHHGGLGVSGGGHSRGGGLGFDRTPLGQSILSLLFGMQNVESDAGKCSMVQQACNNCTGGEGGGSESDFAGGTSSLDQLLQLLKELVSRCGRISGGEKYEIFGLIDRFLMGRAAAG